MFLERYVPWLNSGLDLRKKRVKINFGLDSLNFILDTNVTFIHFTIKFSFFSQLLKMDFFKRVKNNNYFLLRVAVLELDET